MATYSSYRHIEIDKVGKSKKRINNHSAGIVSVLNDSNGSLDCSVSGSSESVASGASTPITNGSGNGYLNGHCNSHNASRRSSTSSNASVSSARFNDTFSRLFGPDAIDSSPKRRNSSFSKDSLNRNPVTGNGVGTWEFHPSKKN